MTGIGLVVAAGSADDHFVAALSRAAAGPLIAAGHGLFARVVDDGDAESRLHRLWADADGMVGVILLGGHDVTERVEYLRGLGLPFAAVVSLEDAGDFPAVVIDAAEAVAVVADFLASRRHERAVYVTGFDESVTSRSRREAMAERFEVIDVGPSAEAAVIAALEIVKAGPATIVFESDVHAVAATTALLAKGFRIPEDVAVVSWTDSALCRSANPAITAVDRRAGEVGEMLGRRMLATVAGGPARVDRAPAPFIVRRDTA